MRPPKIGVNPTPPILHFFVFFDIKEIFILLFKDFDNILDTIRPFPKAPPRKEGPHRGRRLGKTSILTSDESMQEIDQNEKKRKAQKRKAFQPQTSNCSSNKMKKKQKHVSQIASTSIRTRRNTAAAVDTAKKTQMKNNFLFCILLFISPIFIICFVFS